MIKVVFFIFYWINKGFTKILDIFSTYSNSYFVTFKSGVKFKFGAKVENLSKNKDNIGIGKKTVVEGRLLVFNYGGSIKIGDYVYIGAGSNIWSGESIIIGNNVLISHNVNIIDTNSHEIDHLERAERYIELLEYGHPSNKASIVTRPIIIEDYVWISFGASILKGVTIGKGAIIAAGAVITKDVPPYTVVAGNPAVVVRYLKSNQNELA